MQLNEIKNLFERTTDNYLVASILSDGNWHNAVDIMRLKDRPETGFVCRNFAVRSRVSDIKKIIQQYDFTIDSEIDFNGCAKYRIVERQLSLV